MCVNVNVNVSADWVVPISTDKRFHSTGGSAFPPRASLRLFARLIVGVVMLSLCEEPAHALAYWRDALSPVAMTRVR